MKKLLAALLALMMVLGTVAAYAETTGAWDGAYMDEEDFKAYIQYDLANILASIEEQLDDETLAAVTAAKEAGDAAIEAAGSVAEVKAAYADAYDAILAAVAPADGLYTYKKLSNAERTEILGILERTAPTR